MQLTRDGIKQDLDQLTADQLQQVADFISFLKFRDKHRQVTLDPAQLALLTTEFAQEDRAFAEAGMDEYEKLLTQEDLR